MHITLLTYPQCNVSHDQESSQTMSKRSRRLAFTNMEHLQIDENPNFRQKITDTDTVKYITALGQISATVFNMKIYIYI